MTKRHDRSTMQNITITEEPSSRQVEIPELTPPGLYRLLLVPLNTNTDGYRKFYWGCIIPFINNNRIDILGVWETETETHKYLKQTANGNRTTAGLSRGQWKNYIMRLQSYAIQSLEAGWIF